MPFLAIPVPVLWHLVWSSPFSLGPGPCQGWYPLVMLVTGLLGWVAAALISDRCSP